MFWFVDEQAGATGCVVVIFTIRKFANSHARARSYAVRGNDRATTAMKKTTKKKTRADRHKAAAATFTLLLLVASSSGDWCLAVCGDPESVSARSRSRSLSHLLSSLFDRSLSARRSLAACCPRASCANWQFAGFRARLEARYVSENRRFARARAPRVQTLLRARVKRPQSTHRREHARRAAVRQAQPPLH